MIDDGEVDYDFPALNRTKPMADYASKNSAPAGGRDRRARGRGRDEKPWDEFALVEASQEQFEENEKATPKYSQIANAVEDGLQDPKPSNPVPEPEVEAVTQGPRRNPILGQPFSSALRNNSNAADAPTAPTSHATPRLGVSKMLRIRFVNLDASSQTTSQEFATDSYIAEILDFVCKRWALDKGHYVLKVSGTSTLAPLDRTVEALGDRSELDLVRRRFGPSGMTGLSGSPASSSPSAPLFLDVDTPKKGKKGTIGMLNPIQGKQDILSNSKRYNVIRKQAMSFTANHAKVLVFDRDFMHMMPAETGKTLFDVGGKTTSIPLSSIVGYKVSKKHPKVVRVLVYREKETKRYEYEAANAREAVEIAEEVEKGMAPYRNLMSRPY